MQTRPSAFVPGAGARNVTETSDPLKRYIEELTLIRSGPEPFTLASGKKSTFIFNLKNLFGEPEPATLVTQRLFERLRALDFDYVTGLELGAVFPVTAVIAHSHGTDRPVRGFIIRKHAKGHGTKNRIEGLRQIPSRGKVVVIEDVTTTGNSLLDAVQVVREAGMTVETAVTLVDREEGARANLRAHGVELLAIYRKSDFLPADVV